MNKQMKAELSWKIPFEIYKVLGTFDIFELGKISFNKYIDIFEKYKLHRFKKISAEIFYSAVQRIINVYNGDISQLWRNKPSSAKVVYELLQLKVVE